ncbi:MAG: Dyp-type peroxidase [Cyanobium sp.]
MNPSLDRADIQGNLLIPYGRNTFPIGRLLLFHVNSLGSRDKGSEASAHCFIYDLIPQIATSELYKSKRTAGLNIGNASLRQPPPVAINIALTSRGLSAMRVPQETLSGFPSEFIDGMKKRASLLHDNIDCWDPVWAASEDKIDILIVLRANFASALAKIYRMRDIKMLPKAGYHSPEIFHAARELAIARLHRRCCSLIEAGRQRGLLLLEGHAPADDCSKNTSRWQEIESLTHTRSEDLTPSRPFELREYEDLSDLRYTEHEHFGFFDGISDPVFIGQYPQEIEAEELIGQGRREAGAWHPLATGEFLLGYPDEAMETSSLPIPHLFSRNGTFLVVRKLHQFVARFHRAVHEQLPSFQSWLRLDDPEAADEEPALMLLRAKIIGRWNDGTPLVLAPTYRAWQKFRFDLQQLARVAESNEQAKHELTRLKRGFRDLVFETMDSDGSRCPLTAHIRRSNPRDSGDPRVSEQASLVDRRQAGSVLVNRRRILRRGMTYGKPLSTNYQHLNMCRQNKNDAEERGTIFMALCAGLGRQFEFIQQHWLNFGGEFGSGNDVCPVSGVMNPADPSGAAENSSSSSKLIVSAPVDSERPPFILKFTEPMVECRGGAYFFVPSITALRLLSQGLIDPV